MKKAIISTLVLLLIAVAGIFYYFHGKTFKIRITEAQIQNELNARLPLTKSYLLIFDVTLDHPRVSLVNGSRRVKAGLDIILNIQLGNEPKPLMGSLDVSGEIKYVAQSGEIFLTDPIIETLEVQGVPARYADKVKSALTKALAEYYRDHPIYALKAIDSKEAAARLVLKDVVVEQNELVVTLGI